MTKSQLRLLVSSNSKMGESIKIEAWMIIWLIDDKVCHQEVTLKMPFS